VDFLYRMDQKVIHTVTKRKGQIAEPTHEDSSVFRFYWVTWDEGGSTDAVAQQFLVPA
jgi:hypothetical protein